jgi:hypothetical protein
MLILKPNCEMCDRDLLPDSPEARICSYECTFCADCVHDTLHNVCPNCGGGFVPRPIRPARAHRDGTGLRHDPASEVRARVKWTKADIAAFSEKLRSIPPQER